MCRLGRFFTRPNIRQGVGSRHSPRRSSGRCARLRVAVNALMLLDPTYVGAAIEETMNRREALFFAGAAFAAAALAPLRGAAQGTYQARYPERPIKLMVAFSAGGVNDMVARQWADRVKEVLGTVVVENQGGGGGTIATAEVARTPADGYTILLGSTSTMVLNPMTMAKVPYRSRQGLRPDRRHRGLGNIDRGACGGTGEQRRGSRRIRQIQSRQALLRLCRRRDDEQSFRRAVQADHRAQRSRSHSL